MAMTFCIRSIAIRHNVMDIPNKRSSHDIPTPRGGGLAIVIAWFTGITFFFFLDAIERRLFYTFLSGIILAIAGLIDDVYTLKPGIRLLAQSATAILAIFFLGKINPVQIGSFEISSPLLLYPLIIIGIVWFINLFNFLDGTDGYSSMEAITIAALMFSFTGNVLNLVLISSVLGFLFWNWPKAKIFMGDIGSTQLGFILVILGLYYHNNSQISFIHWLMFSSLFWFDATLTLFRRWNNKEKLSIAHRKHGYQRAVQSGLSHKQLIFWSMGLNLIIASLVLVSKKFNSLVIPAFSINIFILYMVTRLIDRRVPFETAVAK